MPPFMGWLYMKQWAAFGDNLNKSIVFQLMKASEQVFGLNAVMEINPDVKGCCFFSLFAEEAD